MLLQLLACLSEGDADGELDCTAANIRAGALTHAPSLSPWFFFFLGFSLSLSLACSFLVLPVSCWLLDHVLFRRVCPVLSRLELLVWEMSTGWTLAQRIVCVWFESRGRGV